jgi:hypothetical protein
MLKDARLKYIKPLVESGTITTFAQIFELIPVTLLAGEVGTNVTTFRIRVSEPKALSPDYRQRIADAFSLSVADIDRLIGPPVLKPKTISRYASF